MKNKALFLDRDGTINVDTGYTYRIDDFRFTDGIVDLCRAAQENGYKIIVVTNQSGIARGYYTENDFHVLTAHMNALFQKEGVAVADVFFCPFLNGEDRKPNPGMFFKARDKYALDMPSCVGVGDKERDVEAGLNAGVGRNFLLSDTTAASKATKVVKSLKEVIPFLIDG